MKYLLLLGANQFQRERALVGAEKAYDGPVVILNQNGISIPNNNAFFSINVASECSLENVLHEVLDFNKKYNATTEYIVPVNDFVLETSLYLSQNLQCNTNSVNTIKICRFKDLMKETLHKAGIPVVRSIKVNSFPFLKEQAKEIGYPVVIKPINFGGSGGVIKVENEQELLEKYNETMKHLSLYAHKFNSSSDEIAVEKYINIKDEYSVEVINTKTSRKIIGITKKFLTQEPYFAEIGHMVPAEISRNTSVAFKVSEIAMSACSALGIEYGISHVEMKVDSEGNVIVIEVGARTAGDGIMDLWEKVHLKNMYELHCLSYMNKLNLDVVNFEESNRKAAIGYFIIPKGILKSIAIDGNDAILHDKYIEKINIKTNIGANISAIKDWSTRYGFVNYYWYDRADSVSENDFLSQLKKLSADIFTIEDEVV